MMEGLARSRFVLPVLAVIGTAAIVMSDLQVKLQVRPRCLRALPIAAVLVAALAIPAIATGEAEQLNDAACASTRLCVAVGNSSSSAQGIAAPFVNGTPATPQHIDGTYSLNGIACTTSSACEAVGVNTAGNPFEGVVATIRVNGT